jgi:hypothetical protein
MYKVTDVHRNGKREFVISEYEDVKKLPTKEKIGDRESAIDSISCETCAIGSTAFLPNGTRVFYLDITNTWVGL